MDGKARFSNRVETYVKYRPSYPKEAIDYLYGTVGFRPTSDIADIGAGTGIFTRVLLERGSQITAIEPNREMREALERALAGQSHLRVLSGSAEATGLRDGSVDYIGCAQSFHWFDLAAARTEFQRVLRAGGQVALIWNIRPIEGTPFLEAYERLLLRYGTDYNEVNHRKLSLDTLADFFRSGTLRVARFSNPLVFDYETLRGRLLSSSYTPVEGHPSHTPLMIELRNLFNRYEQDGHITIDYETVVYTGQL